MAAVAVVGKSSQAVWEYFETNPPIVPPPSTQPGLKVVLEEPEDGAWCEWFGCTETELEAAVAEAGDSPQAVREYFEVRAWCKLFGCTRTELEAAVDVAGKSPQAVWKYFEKNPPKK